MSEPVFSHFVKLPCNVIFSYGGLTFTDSEPAVEGSDECGIDSDARIGAGRVVDLETHPRWSASTGANPSTRPAYRSQRLRTNILSHAYAPEDNGDLGELGYCRRFGIECVAGDYRDDLPVQLGCY